MAIGGAWLARDCESDKARLGRLLEGPTWNEVKVSMWSISTVEELAFLGTGEPYPEKSQPYDCQRSGYSWEL